MHKNITGSKHFKQQHLLVLLFLSMNACSAKAIKFIQQRKAPFNFPMTATPNRMSMQAE